MSGYSGKPVAVKLGIKPGLVVYVDGGPAHTTELSRLERRLPVVIERTVTNGMVWVCWPKRASNVHTDLDENVVRALGLASGVVDVKVAAVDETWSALKFVRRLRDR